MDFMVDQLFNGQWFGVLTIEDVFNETNPAIGVEFNNFLERLLDWVRSTNYHLHLLRKFSCCTFEDWFDDGCLLIKYGENL